MEQLFTYSDHDAAIKAAADKFSQTGCYSIYGVGGSAKSFITAKGIRNMQHPVLIIAVGREQVAQWMADLQFLLPEMPLYTFPFVTSEVFTTAVKSLERVAEQMKVLAHLRERKPCIVIAAAEEAAQYTISPENLDAAAVPLCCHESYERQALVEQLIQSGYERVDLVERRGHFSVRGDIIDIYAVNHRDPLRLEFFGDTLDSMRFFEVQRQISCQAVEQVRILPFTLLSLASVTDSTLPDYFSEGCVVWDEPNRIRESLKKIGKESDEYQKRLCPWSRWVKKPRTCTQIVLSLMAQAVPDFLLTGSAGFVAKRMASFQKQWPVLCEELVHWQQERKIVFVVMTDCKRRASLQARLRQEHISVSPSSNSECCAGKIYIVDGELQNGFELPYAGVIVLCERDIYGMQKKRVHRYAGKSEKINVFTDLKSGDYIVHHAHGIGRYVGLKTIEIDGVHRDYLEIHYAGSDILYVPTDQLRLIQRYIGNEGEIPKLNKMGGKDWQKTRAKAQKSVDNLAEKLVTLYAKREVVPGFAYPPDTPFQREFEEAFPYEETADQLKAVAHIKAAMEKPYPMDCLVCGDVGFGKTEVAMRAIFKAVMGGKQVAVLVPTTVLAQQHYQTFIERLSPFGVKCAVLNRFCSYKERKEILARTLTGDVDVLIGTHSLLNKKVKFKNPGLLVVDEEQRFGVAQKEKWKAWAETIDVLSLSATPIPRTLHMSLVNLREMCVIETPPTDRFPVQTYVTEYDARIVRDAVMREKRRGGQVFFVYNRVDTMARMQEELAALLPELTIRMAHGQMSGGKLEEAMFDFYEGKYDLLLCSSLVENGLDVANANTILIYDADHFGLSQLYQMRGRVGRSHHLAYAYFFYRPQKVLSEVAEKRLEAIKEFTELGSGFKIAMRDLEIRGAGNLLGREQHGNIAGVGFAMYCQMLEAAIKRVKHGEEKITAPLETVLDIQVDAFLDDAYIPVSGQKIEMYQRLALADTEKELQELKNELQDRYGKATPPVQRLLRVAAIRMRAKQLGIVLLSQKKELLEIKWQSAQAAPLPEAMEPVLRSRMKIVRGLPNVRRFSLTGIEDVLSYVQYILKSLETRRKEGALA